MRRLNQALLERSGVTPEYVGIGPVATMPQRVLQFGEGNFLRAFVDWMLDALNGAGLFQGQVVVVQPIKDGLIDMLNEQDGLFTVLLRGMEQGQTVERYRIVTSVRRGVNPYTDWQGFLACARNPDLRFVFSNTTEAGIVYVEEPLPRQQCPSSFPAKVAALLHERWRAFSGDPRKGLILIPCELIEQNGAQLLHCVMQYAQSWGLGQEFQRWLGGHNYFLNTLVDRIVTGYPHAEAEKLMRQLGYEDKLLTAGEIFHLWVIEAPPQVRQELPFDRAGLNVIWTDDMTPYRTRKVRLLNGGHTCSALAAYLAGMETVGEMMNNPSMTAFLERAMLGEIVPSLDLDGTEATAYARSVLERFRNPFIQHRLRDIALNSVSKWTVRVLPSLRDYQRKTGRIPMLLAFSLAALIRFYQGRLVADGRYEGDRNGVPYPLQDNAEILAVFADGWKKRGASGDYSALASDVLGNQALWQTNLNEIPELTSVISRFLRLICDKGMGAALETVVKEQR